MIRAAMAVAAGAVTRSETAAFAREARVGRFATLVLDAVVFGFITFVVNGVYGVTQVTSGFVTTNGAYSRRRLRSGWPWLTLLGVLADSREHVRLRKL
jgi:hypothetical protein